MAVGCKSSMTAGQPAKIRNAPSRAAGAGAVTAPNALVRVRVRASGGARARAREALARVDHRIGTRARL
jgi:hypothetical protein